ncbi:hypothetical protein [Bacillus sp. ISL-37]|uniref:hypothetical protein n=1 Tax=Bacillus sp. ISL-37 TaxID=2819123 RepID=UPI001BEA6E02|nr:hypothetical protein [Bacillus sp. ISL-37]MBT2682248.1 hypothetical protein [Bacillus sp. ISL-37]
MGSYRAFKNRTQNRKSWCVSFRHPLRKDSKGKVGLKIRRGLGTTDEHEAELLVSQMNQLLKDESYWSPTVKQKALLYFDERIVSAFYDSIEPRKPLDCWSVRERIIPLPDKDQGYSVSQLLGTTGAGKTTLIRQLIGTHPEKDRFPSTSTAKTTVCDMEIILKNEDYYKAVVTFFPLEKIRLYIEECVLNAGKSLVDGDSEQTVIRHLLEHTEQRFRLSYLMGNIAPERSDSTNTFFYDEDDDEFEDANFEENIEPKDKEELEKKLRDILIELKSSAQVIWSEVHEELGITMGLIDENEEEIIDQLFEETWKDSSEFNEIVETIFDEVETKFSLVTEGEFTFNTQEWAESWTYEEKDRSKFIETLKQMTGNNARQFGKLLTPLVQGVRISGPFKPIWWEGEIPKLVLIDGEGIGHQAGSSVSNKLSKRMEDVDAILLVDNSKSPMLTEPITILKHIATTGQSSKLHVCFTHFDEVKGDNLLTIKDKRNHVRGSLDNAINEIGNVLGYNIARHLSRQIGQKHYFAAGIHNLIEDNKNFSVKQLIKLIESLQKPKEDKHLTNEAIPIFDGSSAILPIQSGVRDFYKQWDGKLGFLHNKSKKEHWTRIKALSRRLAELGEDEYDDLKPIADLIRSIRESVFKSVIDTPKSWINPTVDEEQKQEVKDSIASLFNKNLYEFISVRMWESQLREWETAYGRKGSGSTLVRANDIKGIYKGTIPVPEDFELNKEAISSLMTILKASITDCGGKIE